MLVGGAGGALFVATDLGLGWQSQGLGHRLVKTSQLGNHFCQLHKPKIQGLSVATSSSSGHQPVTTRRRTGKHPIRWSCGAVGAVGGGVWISFDNKLEEASAV